MKKKAVIIIEILLLICLIIGIKYIIDENRSYNKGEIIKNFNKNIEDFNTVINFINNYNKTSDEYITIERKNYSYIAALTSTEGVREIEIQDKKVIKSIKKLFYSLHYRYINEDHGNSIYFTLRDTSFRFGHGIGFSKDGKALDGFGNKLTNTELIIQSWYYFEAE